MTEIAGYCKDCIFRAKEWTVVWGDPNERLSCVLESYCRIHDNFVPTFGYCHHFTGEYPDE
jgi:hypothetical protein